MNKHVGRAHRSGCQGAESLVDTSAVGWARRTFVDSRPGLNGFSRRAL